MSDATVPAEPSERVEVDVEAPSPPADGRAEVLAGVRRRKDDRRAARRQAATERGVAIKVRGLRKTYGGEGTVLDGIDLDVAPGEFVAVTGPSGSGKTTLMHILAALDRADGGSIEVNGIDLVALKQPTKYRRFEIGLVFQLHNLVPRLTAAQNVEMAMFDTGLGRKERTAVARDLLERVGLGHRAKHKPPLMSGGERQRVAIARALANDPAIILADEPTGSLDDESADAVLQLFDQLRRDAGVTILAVSHDVRLNQLADRVLVLANGKIEAP